MAPLLAAALLAAAPAPDVGARIRDSEQAAQALQGPLDGAWVLTDAAGRNLYLFQLVDPVGGGPLQGAWRDPSGHAPHGDMGVFTDLRREGDRLIIALPPHGDAPGAVIRLRRDGRGLWRGRMWGEQAPHGVILRRD
jgi:hypothetical protein